MSIQESPKVLDAFRGHEKIQRQLNSSHRGLPESRTKQP